MGVADSDPQAAVTDPPEHDIVGNPRFAQRRYPAVAQGMERRAGRLRYAEPSDERAEPAVPEIGVGQVCADLRRKHYPAALSMEMGLEGLGVLPRLAS